MLAQLRQHTTIFHLYAGDNGDRFPHFASATSYTVLRSQIAGIAAPIRYFEQSAAWPVALADAYYDGNMAPRVFHSPSANPVLLAQPATTYSTYMYGCSFVAAPEFWRTDTRMVPPMQLRATVKSDVTWPANKSLLVTAGLVFETRKDPPTAFVDGHGQVVKLNERPRAYPEGVADLDLYMGHNGDEPPFLHTVDGIRGMDVRTR